MVNKYYDLATVQKEIPASVRDHYEGLAVHADACIGCGACESIEPSVFQLDDEGISTVLEDNILKADSEMLEEAVSSCPTNAISKVE